MSDNYVTKVEFKVQLIIDSDQWQWTLRVFTAWRGEAYLRDSGVDTSPELAFARANHALPRVIGDALVLRSDDESSR